jgi:arylamine N-acetyltransferase
MPSTSSPLTPPTDSTLLTTFQQRFPWDRDRSPCEQLAQLASAFARLPYENLTKIIKQDQHRSAEQTRRTPDEVVSDHLRLGTGGTCFSLTATLLYLVRSLGYRAEPILADRRYGANTHTALLVWVDEQPHLLDPGYLIVQPIPIALKEPTTIQTSFNQLRIVPAGADRLDLLTIEPDRPKYRLTWKTDAADEGQFLSAWDDSFQWDMMHYPLLTRVDGQRQIYVQGAKMRTRDRERIERDEIAPDQWLQTIHRQFGIDSRVIANALRILKRKGEWHGGA